jgi:DNA-binding winged helix-turn-helix (wHTH) protein/Tfp pilus assembly protein PilF
LQDPWEYVFGPFRLDPSRELLTCGGKAIALPSRLFALLYALIIADGKVVSREELSSLIWPGANVAEANLSQHIYMLRQLLGESGRERQFIVTVHGKGFRFAAPVTLVTPAHPLSKRLTAKEPGRSVSDENPLQAGYEAVAFYSRASALMDRPGAAPLRTAIEYLKAALAIDSEFVPALVAVARAYTLLAQNSYAAADWAFPRALNAIELAFARAPSSASVHAVNAEIALLARWDWHAAKASIDMAMSLNSASPLVRVSAAWLYEYAGNHMRASTELQEALLLLPHSPGLQLLLGRFLVMMREYGRAIEHLSQLLEGDQQFDLARQRRAEAYVLAGRPEEAIADLLFIQRDPTEDAASRLPLLCRAYACAGDKVRALETFECLVAASHVGFVTHNNLAMCLIGLDRYDEALEQLERALAAREPSILLLHASPWFAPVVTSERFERVVSVHKESTRDAFDSS